MALNVLWYLLIGLLFTVYLILDGFDLGVGILSPFLGKTEEEKRKLLKSIGPFWDGNEVWLLAGGGALFAAFPVAYATVFSGLYVALVLLLLALMLRILSIEFRNKLEGSFQKRIVDKCFFLSSLLIVVILSIALSNIVRGLPLVEGKHYYGGMRGLLNGYSVFTAVFAVAVLVMQGSIYTVLKQERELSQRARRVAAVSVWLVLIFYVGSVVLTFLYAGNRFSNFIQHRALSMVLPLPLAMGFMAYRYIKKGYATSAFLCSSLLITSLMAIVGIGNYPFLVPNLKGMGGLTILNAASTPKTLHTMLIIALIGVPLVVGYTVYVYRMFRGKVNLEEGY
jgi:cytochrome d ubiquinol oxidase subunit II